MVTPDSLHCEAILLAAGRSRRMNGIDKLLLQVEGMALVRRSALLYLDLGMPLTVVMNSDDSPVAEALVGLDCRLVVNRSYDANTAADAHADDGQQASVRTGLDATPLEEAGVIVALADQPLLTPEDIRALAAHFDRHEATLICVPRFAGQRGNPVIFPLAVARHLRHAGTSPRAFIAAHPGQVAWFEATNDHFTRDVDTAADAAELLGVGS